jgi:hypothetical protein
MNIIWTASKSVLSPFGYVTNDMICEIPDEKIGNLLSSGFKQTKKKATHILDDNGKLKKIKQGGDENGSSERI